MAARANQIPLPILQLLEAADFLGAVLAGSTINIQVLRQRMGDGAAIGTAAEPAQMLFSHRDPRPAFAALKLHHVCLQIRLPCSTRNGAVRCWVAVCLYRNRNT